MARLKPVKAQEPQATYGWLGKGHKAYKMVVGLLKTYYGERLGLGDVRPALRSGGKAVSWGAKLLSVPGPLRALQSEGPTNGVLLIDEAWWNGAGLREQEGVLHGVLAQAAKEERVVVYASAVAAHGAYTVQLEDVVQHGYKQLKLRLEEAEETWGIGEGSKGGKVEGEVLAAAAGGQ
jgi:hypothetical protein